MSYRLTQQRLKCGSKAEQQNGSERELKKASLSHLFFRGSVSPYAVNDKELTAEVTLLQVEPQSVQYQTHKKIR